MIRLAITSDMDEIYLMGYDVWGEGEPIDAYLEICRNAPKYKRGRWFVLTDEQGEVVSSPIVYRGTFNLEAPAAGIGSIATPGALRRRGYAAHLVRGVLDLLTQEGAHQVYLFSDISPEYYEKLGFRKLPPDFQKYPESICMVWGREVEDFASEENFAPPTYF